MSWLPELQIGLWNAWILMLYFPLQWVIMVIVDKVAGTGDLFKKMGGNPSEKRDQRADRVYLVLLLLLIAYSIFLPLKVGSGWFIAGLIIYFAAMAMLLTALVNAAATPPGQPFTRGMFRFSRHPLYGSMAMIFVGTGLAAASGAFMLFSILIMIPLVIEASAEEKECLKRYGAVYQEYMERTPQWIGLPKGK